MNFRGAQRRSQRCPRVGAAQCVFCLAIVGGLAGAAAPSRAACGRPAGMVEVASIDGRLDVALADGRMIRLAGLDLPSVDRAPPEIAKAARDDLAGLLVGKQAELFALASGSDRWGRILADLGVPDASGGESSAASALLSGGYARVRPEFETRGCAAARLALEDQARRSGLGVWRDAAFAVLPADDGRRLRQYDGHFVVVEGRVRRVGFGRSRLYLDLGPRGAGTIVVQRRLEPILARSGNPVSAWVGETIRARGAIDGRFGPRIEVSDPAMIEFVRRPDASGAEDPHP
jgi:endonuclease YncB( thermonuclease family)